MSKTLAEKLKQRGLRQTDVARRMGMDKSAIFRALHGSAESLTASQRAARAGIEAVVLLPAPELRAWLDAKGE